MPPPVEFLIHPDTVPDRPPVLRRAHDQYMWLARLQLRLELEEKGNDPDNSEEEYSVNEVDLDHGPEAMARWNAERAAFVRCVKQAAGDLEQAMHLDGEMRAILRAANSVAQGLIAGYVDEVSLDVFSEWRDVLARVDRFEDQVALVLNVGDQPATHAAAPGPPRLPQAGEVNHEVTDFDGAQPAELSGRSRDLLTTMLRLGAIAQSKRKTWEQIVTAINHLHDKGDYVRDIRQLKALNYYGKIVGPGGGVWLTRAGQDEARRLSATGT